MKIKVIRKYPKIIHLKFRRQKDIASTLLRFQEHFESPKFRGKIFTLKEFKKFYKKFTKKKKFTYYKDWTGFNFPSYILKPFYDGKFDPLSKKEKKILEILKNEKGKFYVISTFQSDDIRHETAHALYYLNEAYRKEVLKVLSSINTKKFKKMLKKDGYHKSTWNDETHAYLLEEKSYIRKKLKIKVKPFLKVRKKLKTLFKKYS